MAQKPIKVVILAAGKSTRMKSDTPKVLHKLAGIPILRWVLQVAASLNPEEVIVVVGHGREAVIKAFGEHPGLRFVTQEPQLGTGHALMQARSALEGFQGDVCVLCGDVPLLRHETISTMLETYRERGAIAGVLTAEPDDPFGYGRIIRDESGNVTQIVEQKDLTAEQESVSETNTGTYLFSAEGLFAELDALTTDNAQQEYYLTDVVQRLAAAGRPVVGSLCDDQDETIGINDRLDLVDADAIARSWILLDLLENHGVTTIDPTTCYIEAGVEIGRDAIIYPNTVIRSGVRIGKRCQIGPFAHLRAGTVLGDDCKVGAFVETKSAEFGAGSKAGHLAYLGDVTLGEDVNIGAGSIVANYDGKRKHKTEIGTRAFIGCGTVLVAPVKIGQNAQTGANTVVPANRDVADNTVVVGAPARELRKKD